MKYTLMRAIQLDPEVEPITELALREKLVAGDFRGIKIAALGDLGEMKTEDMLKIIGRLSGKSEPEMNALSPGDFAELAVMVRDFFVAGSSVTKKVEPASSTSTPQSGS